MAQDTLQKPRQETRSLQLIIVFLSAPAADSTRLANVSTDQICLNNSSPDDNVAVLTASEAGSCSN